MLIWLIVSLILVSNLMRTRDGRAFLAVRDHYLSAEMMGINLVDFIDFLGGTIILEPS